MITKYTVGFMFNPGKNIVALIIKGSDKGWQSNKLNGIGGHVEEGEEFLACMVREFKEETGYQTTPEQWSHYSTIESHKAWIQFYATIGDVGSVFTTTEEQVVKIALRDIDLMRTDMVENLQWQIAMALDHLNDGRPTFAAVYYHSADTVKGATHEPIEEPSQCPSEQYYRHKLDDKNPSR